MDAQARLQRLLDEAPFVRALARSLLAEDVDEVEQQTWLRVLQRRGDDVSEPRSWLACVVRSVAANLHRGRQRRRAHETAAAAREAVPSSAELMQREELRRELVNAVDALPAELRAVVLLRWFEGLAPRTIATRLGLPVTTVWNRLRSALALLRERLDASHRGDRRAWAAPLGAWVLRPDGIAAATLLTGVIAMTTKTKVAAAALLLLLAALWLWTWPFSAPVMDNRPVASTGTPLRGTAAPVAATEPPARTELAGVDTSRPDATGALVVHVRYASDRSPGCGLPLVLRRRGGDVRVGVLRAVTDIEGRARFDGLRPGAMYCTAMPTRHGDAVEVKAGRTAELELELRQELDLRGVVVDASGKPVAGAAIEFAACSDSLDAETVATTAADGTFGLRSCFTPCVIGARAEGFAASRMQCFWIRAGWTAPISMRIVLDSPGCAVDGIVLDEKGTPVPDAVVRVGEGSTDNVAGGPGSDSPPLPAQVRTDTSGRFHAFGVGPGRQPLRVRAAGFAPWQRTYEIDPKAQIVLVDDVVLTPGFTCNGVLHKDDGSPFPDESVSSGEPGDFVQYQARTAADGTFTVSGLPPGDVEFVVYTREGMARARVHGEAGAVVPCEMRVQTGIVLSARVTDKGGTPLGEICVACRAEGAREPWYFERWTAADGSVLVPQCPAGCKLSIRVSGEGIVAKSFDGVDPRAKGLVFEVARETVPRGKLTGVVCDAEGMPVANAEVLAGGPDREHAITLTGADGRFALDVVPGAWHLRLVAKEHPILPVSAREVRSGGAADFGTLTLHRGGRVEMLVVGANAAQVAGTITDAEEQRCGWIHAGTLPSRSDLLMPGEYRLHVHGPGRAAQVLPFTLRDGQTTLVEVPAVPGIRLRLQVARADGAGFEYGVSVRVRSGGILVLPEVARLDEGKVDAELWLAPGRYELQAESGRLRGEASFVVGTSEGPVLRVELR
jgi:RNA polymerase sigma-70 factor (ECF subfamily)